MTARLPLVLAFLCVLGLAAILSSQGSIQPYGANRVEYGPHPRDFVQINSGTPYTVPPGKVLVVTALGSKIQGPDAALFINGLKECTTEWSGLWAANSQTPFPIPPVAAQSGDVVTTTSAFGQGAISHAWGYLAEASAPSANVPKYRVPLSPHPRDMVVLREGTPYTVPAGKLFVLTSLGMTRHVNASSILRINGQADCKGPSSDEVQSTLTEMPLGRSVPAGSVLEVVSSAAAADLPARAWGYLSDL